MKNAMKRMRRRHRALDAGIFAAGACALVLGISACAPAGSEQEEASSSATSTAPVSVNPDAPALKEKLGAFNFIRTNDDGTMAMLATVHVKSTQDWVGLVDEKSQFSVLEKGKYIVQARGASGCSGVGSPASEGLGTIGEVHSSGDNSVDVWSTPTKIDSDSFTTVALVDEKGDLAACAKSVKWTEPTASNDS